MDLDFPNGVTCHLRWVSFHFARCLSPFGQGKKKKKKTCNINTLRAAILYLHTFERVLAAGFGKICHALVQAAKLPGWGLLLVGEPPHSRHPTSPPSSSPSHSPQPVHLVNRNESVQFRHPLTTSARVVKAIDKRGIFASLTPLYHGTLRPEPEPATPRQ